MDKPANVDQFRQMPIGRMDGPAAVAAVMVDDGPTIEIIQAMIIQNETIVFFIFN